jgi:cobalt-zinc-cadmium efflux system membrane fusion protein
MLDPQTKTVEVHAHIEGDKTGLLEGMSVVAMIHQGKNKVTAVPNGAIASEGGSDYIFIQQQTSSKEVIFTKTPVRKGASELGFTEIIPATPIPPDAKIALSQAFFIMGKMTNTGEE